MLEYQVITDRIDSHGSQAQTKAASILLDTSVKGRKDAFNPAELLLASLSACMLKNIERVAPIINFSFEGVTISIKGYRQDKPPKMHHIKYHIDIDTDESDKKIELLHRNIQTYGTVFNTILAGSPIEGTINRIKGE